MTKFGMWLLAGCVLLLLLLMVIAFWSVFFWIGLALLVGGLTFLGFRLWAFIHASITQAQLRAATVAKARAEAGQAQAVEAALWNQTRLIPQHAIGMLLESVDQAPLQQVWTWSQQTGTHKTENYLIEGATEEPTLPTAPDFRALKGEIGPNHFLLGTYLDEDTRKSVPLWVTLDGVITLVAVGPQGLGKTTLARSLALQQAMYAGELHVMDYYNDVATEMRPYFPHCYYRPQDMEAYAAEVLFPEMDRRAAAYQDGERQFPPWLLLLDEWYFLRPACPTLAEALERGFTDWRKLNFRQALFSVQLERADLGVSKGAVSTIALFTGNENTARTWGLSGKGVLEELRKLYTAGRGYCVVSSQTLQRHADLIALPDVSPALFREILLEYRPDIRERMRAPVRGEGEEGPPFLSSPFPADRPLALVTPLPLEERKGEETLRISRLEREAIVQEWRKGTAPSYIHKVLRRASNYYYVVQRVLAEEEQRLAREQEDADEHD